MRALCKKYLVGDEGLMLRRENWDILNDVLSENDNFHNAIVSGCSNLSERDYTGGHQICCFTFVNFPL